MIADAGTTIVDDHRRRHDVPPRGVRPRARRRRTDPARAALAEFVAAVTDLPATVGAAELGAEEPFVSRRST